MLNILFYKFFCNHTQLSVINVRTCFIGKFNIKMINYSLLYLSMLKASILVNLLPLGNSFEVL